MQNLNLILLTSSELYGLRRDLKEMKSPESHSLFAVLYRSWCHSPVATFSLCLLSQVYDHACDLLQEFADMEVGLLPLPAAPFPPPGGPPGHPGCCNDGCHCGLERWHHCPCCFPDAADSGARGDPALVLVHTGR